MTLTGFAIAGWFFAGVGVAIMLMGSAWSLYSRRVLRAMHEGAARRFVRRGEWERAIHVRASLALLELDWALQEKHVGESS